VLGSYSASARVAVFVFVRQMFRVCVYTCVCVCLYVYALNIYIYICACRICHACQCACVYVYLCVCVCVWMLSKKSLAKNGDGFRTIDDEKETNTKRAGLIVTVPLLIINSLIVRLVFPQRFRELPQRLVFLESRKSMLKSVSIRW